MRRALPIWVVIVAIAAALAGSAVAADAPAGPELIDAGTALFPDRAYVIALPVKRKLTASDVTVTEDGRAVENETVVPANSEGGVGTVILIDASNSMTGSIDKAMAAARSFAKTTQGQAISVVTFNTRPTVQLPFTFDQKQIAQALATSPDLAQGTKIYDALAAAQAQIRDAKLGAGRIVLISDGADVGSTIPADTAVGALENEKVRVYTIGIDSPDFTADDLESIAETTGGSFALAKQPAALQGIFDELGVKASNEYVLRYRSEARPGRDIDVVVAIKGVPEELTTSYTSPRAGQGAPYEESFWSRIVQGWPAMLLITALVLGLIGYAIVRLSELRSNRKLRRRLGEYVEVEEEADRRRTDVSALLATADSSTSRLQQMDWFQRFALETEIAGMGRSPQRLMAMACIGGLVLGVILASLVSPFLILTALLPPFFLWGEVSRRAAKTRARFQEQLDDNLEVLGSGLRAGHSLAGAMSMVVDEADEPSRSEFRRVVTDERLGVPLDQALEVTAARMKSTDLDQVALLALIQREAGGNMAEVLDQIIVNIRAREEVRRLVKVLTAQGRMARWVIIGVPVGLFFMILMINPDQIQPLFHDPIGQVSLVLAIVGIFLGSWFIKRIVAIEL